MTTLLFTTTTVHVNLSDVVDLTDAAPLPAAFCWTRFGTEAGEPIEAIVERKERERRTTGGVFYWGIGNSVAPALDVLIKRSDPVEVLFSPMTSKPRSVDVRPASVVTWTAGKTLAGTPYVLPSGVQVTSRGGNGRRSHYALVCHRSTELALSNVGSLDLGQLRNLGRHTRVGTSQVTAVVERLDTLGSGQIYEVAFRATLVPPYVLYLTTSL